MPPLPALWPETGPWIALIAAFGFGLRGMRNIAMPFVFAAGGMAWVLGLLSTGALAILAAGMLLAPALSRLTGSAKAIGHGILMVACLGLGLHLLPGIDRLTILDTVRSGPESATYSLRLSLDKPLVFILLLLAWPPLLQSPGPKNARIVVGALAGLMLLFPVALASGAIHWELSLPPWLPLFLIANLMLTCLAEESFFRGYLQRGLSGYVGIWPAIGITAVLFGVAHFAGGPALMIFATLAGLGYGLCYQFGGGLTAAVLAHFGFNVVHLVFFTYPGPA